MIPKSRSLKLLPVTSTSTPSTSERSRPAALPAAPAPVMMLSVIASGPVGS
jgi:hypothetical protein